jgi:hypothetical protein
MKIECNPSELSKAVKLLVTLFNNISMLDIDNAAELENAVVILEDFIGGIEDRIATATLSKKSVKPAMTDKKKSVEVQRRDQFKLICHLNGSVFTVDIADIEKLQPLVTSLKNEIINGKLIHYIPTAIRDEKLTWVVELDGADPDIPESRFKEIVSFHQVITVQDITRFGRELLVLRHQDEYNRTQTTLSPVYTDVMSCYRESWSSLIDLVASLLVTYHAINGNLNRISCCKECGKLIYQNRVGCRSYCSTDCRVRHNQAEENPIQRKCRRRQNAWAQNKIKAGHPNFLLKGQCGDCISDLPGGQCKFIRERHERLKDEKQISSFL